MDNPLDLKQRDVEEHNLDMKIKMLREMGLTRGLDSLFEVPNTIFLGSHDECCDPNVQSTVVCFLALKRFICEVFECLECHPSDRRIKIVLTCILLNELAFIENEIILINNSVNSPIFGLNEIKNEIRFIENEVILINNSVNSPIFGLNEIKNEIRFIENEVILINNSVNNSIFGLNEIKNEIRFIENEVILINNTVNNGVFGLNEIKNEIRFIENEVILINNTVNNGVFGLNEIKNEIRFIENEVILINNTINNSVFGFNEIKNEIRFIENEVILINNSVNSPIFGLNEIKNEIRFIENEIILINNSVNSPIFGLNEIKNEIRAIENVIVPTTSNAVTSGPIFTDNATALLNVKVLNNTNTPKTVRVRVFNLDTCPITEIFNAALPINGQCINEINGISLGQGANQVQEFEILITNLVPGLYPAAIQTTNGGARIFETALKSVDFVPKIGNFVP